MIFLLISSKSKLTSATASRTGSADNTQVCWIIVNYFLTYELAAIVFWAYALIIVLDRLTNKPERNVCSIFSKLDEKKYIFVYLLYKMVTSCWCVQNDRCKMEFLLANDCIKNYISKKSTKKRDGHRSASEEIVASVPTKKRSKFCEPPAPGTRQGLRSQIRYSSLTFPHSLGFHASMDVEGITSI